MGVQQYCHFTANTVHLVQGECQISTNQGIHTQFDSDTDRPLIVLVQWRDNGIKTHTLTDNSLTTTCRTIPATDALDGGQVYFKIWVVS